jgi:hypothetical protein
MNKNSQPLPIVLEKFLIQNLHGEGGQTLNQEPQDRSVQWIVE